MYILYFIYCKVQNCQRDDQVMWDDHHVDYFTHIVYGIAFDELNAFGIILFLHEVQ